MNDLSEFSQKIIASFEQNPDENVKCTVCGMEFEWYFNQDAIAFQGIFDAIAEDTDGNLVGVIRTFNSNFIWDRAFFEAFPGHQEMMKKLFTQVGEEFGVVTDVVHSLNYDVWYPTDTKEMLLSRAFPDNQHRGAITVIDHLERADAFDIEGVFECFELISQCEPFPKLILLSMDRISKQLKEDQESLSVQLSRYGFQQVSLKEDLKDYWFLEIQSNILRKSVFVHIFDFEMFYKKWIEGLTHNRDNVISEKGEAIEKLVKDITKKTKIPLVSAQKIALQFACVPAELELLEDILDEDMEVDITKEDRQAAHDLIIPFQEKTQILLPEELCEASVMVPDGNWRPKVWDKAEKLDHIGMNFYQEYIVGHSLAHMIIRDSWNRRVKPVFWTTIIDHLKTAAYHGLNLPWYRLVQFFPNKEEWENFNSIVTSAQIDDPSVKPRDLSKLFPKEKKIPIDVIGWCLFLKRIDYPMRFSETVAMPEVKQFGFLPKFSVDHAQGIMKKRKAIFDSKQVPGPAAAAAA